jgi:hypothetical protein
LLFLLNNEFTKPEIKTMDKLEYKMNIWRAGVKKQDIN